MNITLDQTNRTSAKLRVQLHEADYAPQVDEKIKEYSKKASIKGFRPGKVPAGMIRKMYGKGILVDQINEILHESVNKYIKDNNLHILGEPLPTQEDQEKIDWDTQKEFEFNFELGLLPDFELPLQNLTVEGYKVELDQATVDQAYEQIQQQFGKTTNPEVSETGDYLYGDLKQEEGEFNTKTLIPTSKVVNGADKFIGVKPGDLITFDLQEAFNNDASAIAHVTGQTKDQAAELKGNFTFTVDKINRHEAAEFDQEVFDKVFGKDVVTTKEEFDAKVRQVIQENYDRENENVINHRIIQQLVKETNIEVPEEFFKKWLVTANKGKLTPEQVEENYSQYIEELKWSMIRNKVVEENHDIKVSNEEVMNSAKSKMLAQFGLPSVSEEMDAMLNEMVEKQLKDNNGRGYMNEYENILANKVLEEIKSKIIIVEKPITAEEFRNLSFE